MTKIENRQTFLDRLKGHFSQVDIDLVEFAYDLAKEAHRPQKRDGGERYFEHPRAGCLIMMDELGLYDRDLLISFLFHDVGEDTPLLGNREKSYDVFVSKAKYRLGKLFGESVADTVIRLTKPSVDHQKFQTSKEASDFYIEELRKGEDALIGKAVDRLHNLRTLIFEGCSVQKIKRQITQTESVYLPLFALVQGKKKVYAEMLIKKIKSQIEVLKAST